MANKQNLTNKILRGNNGKVWINGEELGNISTMNAKATPKFENVSFVGDPATYQSYTSWEGKGSLKLKKVKSVGLKYIGESLKTGIFPEIVLESKTTDPVSGQSERVVLNGVLFTELTLVDLEAQKMIEEDLAFTFSDYEVKETIG
ncbi:phage tail tube protein [Clostridium frigidicarnis]|uniref:Phage tail tube protein n=1 Tax=Clostridium frigidicarnis TaxID=84698 RepID=A0A1I0V1H3_9CLOT|nr:phage tail tube protein [Clostridium frigidicarnis]SFA70141.1 Phage tail tube protein [Clostridium frigidicarnis]